MLSRRPLKALSAFGGALVALLALSHSAQAEDPWPWLPPVLEDIRDCESGGNYTIVSPNGLYRGAYQFDIATWRSVGGQGLPERAAPIEQDFRAWLLYLERGSQPWPVCG